MKKLEYYAVAEGASVHDLEETVGIFMRNGFVCQGGIYCKVFFLKRYYQAMVKYED